MITKQAILDRVRVINKRFTNKLMIHFAGKKNDLLAILVHTGRKSGNRYRIPVIVMPLGNDFVIALTYGKKVDWYHNVVARGGCSIQWQGREIPLTAPRLIPAETGLQAFPGVVRGMLRFNRIEYFLRQTPANNQTDGE